MAKFSARLRYLRTEAQLSQQELADHLSRISESPKGCSKSSINMYERGEREPGLDMLEAMADFFNVDMDFLLGKSDVRNRFSLDVPANLAPAQFGQVPLIGAIACGAPILAEEHIEDLVDLPRHIKADFALTCKGDSMIGAGIRDGDVVYIRQQDTVDNGQIAAVLVDSTEATLKRFYFDGQTVSLLAENPAYPPLIFPGEQAANIRVIGRAVAYTHGMV